MIGSATKIGEVIEHTLMPITGASSFVDFVDEIEGETVNRYFQKTFSYAPEGLFFTEFKVLSLVELHAIVVAYRNSYIIKVKYTRAGADNTGTLTLNSLSIETTNVTIDNGKEYNDSNFIKFFESTNEEVELWATNVLKKIFLRGALAAYVLRGKNLIELDAGGSFNDDFNDDFDM